MDTASYLRISDDKLGRELGVDRQRKDNAERARARGWGEPVEFVDNDLSASKGRHRPGYTALMAAVGRGEVKRVVVWHQSRLWRNRRERAEGIDLLRQHKVTLVCVRGAELDMATAIGRGVAGMVGEFDTLEAEVTAERVAREIQQRAEQGRHRSSARLYGYTLDRASVVEAEAAVLRRAFDQLVTGLPLRAVAREWGIPHNTCRDRLRNLAYAGVCVHLGREYPAVWPAIVSRGTVDATRAILDNPGRVSNHGGRAKVALGSGLYRCQRCDRPVFAGIVGKRRVYKCLSWRGGCGRAWARDTLDSFVEAVVAERLGRDDLADLLPVDRPDLDALSGEAQAIRTRLAALPAQYVLLGMDDAQVAEVNRVGKARLTEIEAALAANTAGRTLGQLLACHDPVQLWRDIPADQIERRQATIAAIMTVTLGQPPIGGAPRDRDRAVTRMGSCVTLSAPAVH